MYCIALFLIGVSLVTAEYRGNYGRIIGGNEARIEDHPYKVSIQYFGKHICGGAIVTTRHILTANQCLPPKNVNPNFVIIRAGTSNRTNGGASYEVLRWLNYPRTVLTLPKDILNYDIAFYIVKSPIEFGPNVQPVQLVGKEERPQPGDMLTVLGWGQDQLGGDSKPEILRSVRVPLLDQDLCHLATSKADFVYTKNMMCAGGSGRKLAHTGDYGGPAVNDDNKLVGIITGRRPLFLLGYPIVLTDVTSDLVRKFIDDKLNETIIEIQG